MARAITRVLRIVACGQGLQQGFAVASGGLLRLGRGRLRWGMVLQHAWAVAVAVARAAGSEALLQQGRVAHRVKSDGSPVSDADLAAETIIRGRVTPVWPWYLPPRSP